MDLELAGKVAIVTGASRGVGKAIALELAREGVDVAICARSRDALDASAKELAGATGRRILPIVADTTSSESVRRLVETTRARSASSSRSSHRRKPRPSPASRSTRAAARSR